MNLSSRRQADCSSLVIRAVPGCTDPSIVSGDQQGLAKDLIPCLFDTNQTSDIAHVCANVPSYSELTIGRAPSCWVRLRDPSISGRHCKLVLVRTLVKTSREPCDGRASSNISCYIIDQSTNGTFLDQNKIPKDVPTLVLPDQVVSLGRGRPTSNTSDEETAPVFAFTVSVTFSTRNSIVDLDDNLAGSTISHEFSGSLDMQFTENQHCGASATTTLVPTSRPHCTQTIWPNDDSNDRQQQFNSKLYDKRKIADAGSNSSSTIDDHMLGPSSEGNVLGNESFTGGHHLSLRFVTPPPSSRRPPMRQSTTPQQSSACNLVSSVESQSISNLGSRNGSGHTANNNWGGTCSSSLVGSNRLTELVKRLQREGTKKDEEIAEMAGELERSELQRQELVSKLKELTEELQDAQKKLLHVNERESMLEREQECAAQTIQQLKAELKDAERWERKAQELHTQISVLNRRFDNWQAVLREAQTARDEALGELKSTRAQIDELELRKDQAIGLLKSSREEAERLRSELEIVTKSEQELSDRNRTLERRFTSSENAWKEAQSLAEKQLNELQEKAYGYLAEAESHARLIEAQKVISLHVNGLLRNAFALTAKAGDPEGLRDLMARGAESELLEGIFDLDDGKSSDTQLFHDDPTRDKDEDPNKRSSSRAVDSRKNNDIREKLCEFENDVDHTPKRKNSLTNLHHDLTRSLTPLPTHRPLNNPIASNYQKIPPSLLLKLSMNTHKSLMANKNDHIYKKRSLYTRHDDNNDEIEFKGVPKKQCLEEIQVPLLNRFVDDTNALQLVDVINFQLNNELVLSEDTVSSTQVVLKESSSEVQKKPHGENNLHSDILLLTEEVEENNTPSSSAIKITNELEQQQHIHENLITPSYNKDNDAIILQDVDDHANRSCNMICHQDINSDNTEKLIFEDLRDQSKDLPQTINKQDITDFQHESHNANETSNSLYLENVEKSYETDKEELSFEDLLSAHTLTLDI